MGKHNTPMLDELEKGPWPSFVSDIKQQAEKGKHVLKEAPNDFLGVMELSFQDRVTHWKHGGIVGVFGYGGGIIAGTAISLRNFLEWLIFIPSE